jgi:signal peptidase II
MTDDIQITAADAGDLSSSEARKAWTYGSLLAGIVALDQLTKVIVQMVLPLYQPIPVLGDFFRLTYIFNPGAAFGLHVGPASRHIFLALTVGCVVVLFLWFRGTSAADRLRLVAISFIAAGALGNFIDRIRSPRGVIDFLDFGIGNLRWPVFNVADIGVTVGAILLAVSLWREEQEVAGERR